MNKFSIIAASMLAIAATGAIADETKAPVTAKVFGEVRAFVEATSQDDVDASVQSTSSKLGVVANAEVAENISVFGELSGDVDVNSANALTTRFGYAGVQHDKLGAVSFGKHMSLMEIFVDKGDQFFEGGNVGVQKQGFYQSNSVRYMNKMGDIEIGALAVMTDDAQNEAIDSFQIGAGFAGIGVAYAFDNVADIGHYGIGVERKFGPILVAGSLSMTDAATDVIGYEAVVGYDLNDSLTIKGGYGDTDAANDDGVITGATEYKFGNSGAIGFATVDYDLDSEDWTARSGISFTF
jgi:predicted porin